MDNTKASPLFAVAQSKMAANVALFIVIVVAYFAYVRYATSLRKIPGPFLASLSTLWIVRKQRQLKRPIVDLELHRKYGPLVRVSPHEVIIASPAARKPIYGTTSKFKKGDWYIGTGDDGWSGNDRLDFLSELDMEKYWNQRRLIGGAFSATHMKSVEPHLDELMQDNIAAMKQRSGVVVNIDTFFTYWGSDCLQAATFGKSRGFVVHNAEDGAIAGVNQYWFYMHWVGFYPQIHQIKLYYENLIEPKVKPALKYISRLRGGSKRPQPESKPKEEKVFQDSIFKWTRDQLQAKREKRPQPTDPTSTIADRLLQIQVEKPELKDQWITDACVQNFNAGTETLGITIGTLINFLLSHPACLQRVQQEIASARAAGKISAMPKLKEIDNLPYLSACLSESKRLHPPFSSSLPRKVPATGAELEGYFLPPGTTVGINPYVLGRDESLYGQDADDFRPERWLDFSEEHLKALEGHSMFFGTGARSCPGQHVAEAIITKAIPLLLMNFDFRYVRPEQEKTIRSTFMTRLDNIMIQWKVREAEKI